MLRRRRCLRQQNVLFLARVIEALLEQGQVAAQQVRWAVVPHIANEHGYRSTHSPFGNPTTPRVTTVR